MAILPGGSGSLESSQAEHVLEATRATLEGGLGILLPEGAHTGVEDSLTTWMVATEDQLHTLSTQVLNLESRMADLSNIWVELVGARQLLDANRFSLFFSGASFMLQSLIREGFVQPDILNNLAFKFWAN